MGFKRERTMRHSLWETYGKKVESGRAIGGSQSNNHIIYSKTEKNYLKTCYKGGYYAS